MRLLLDEAAARGWEEARGQFTTDVLGGTLRAPSQSRWSQVRAKLTPDQVTELLDPARYTGLCRQFAEEGALRARNTAAALAHAGFPARARPA